METVFRQIRGVCGLAGLFVASVNAVAVAEEAEWADRFVEVVEAESALPAEARAELTAVIERAASERSLVDQDKAEHGPRHFQAYLQARAAYIFEIEDAGPQAELMAAEVEWAIGNYLNMLPLPAAERAEVQQTFDRSIALVEDWVRQAYDETPAAVRTRVIDEFRNIAETYGNRVGSYFEPPLFQAHGEKLTAEQLKEMVGDGAGEFSIRADLSPDVRESVYERYVATEATRVRRLIHKVVHQEFDHGTSVARYKNKPREVQALERQVEEARIEAANRQIQQLPQRFKRELRRERSRSSQF